MFFMAGSPQRTVELRLAGSATHVSVRGRSVGGYAADLILQLPARGPVPLRFIPYQ